MKPLSPTAFPSNPLSETEGMTLRDYFAAKALTAIVQIAMPLQRDAMLKARRER